MDIDTTRDEHRRLKPASDAEATPDSETTRRPDEAVRSDADAKKAPDTAPDDPSKTDGPRHADAEHSDKSQDDDEAAPPVPLREKLRRHKWLVAGGALALLIAIVAGSLYWLHARQFVSTDDAFVDARSFSVAPKVSGYITDVFVTDNQHVNAGEKIAQIDRRDYEIAVEQMTAQVGTAQANVANVAAQIVSQQSQIEQARDQVEQALAQQKFAQQEADRAQDLVAKGAGTVQQQQRTKSDLDAADANLSRAKTVVTVAERQIKVLEAQKDGAQASLAQAQAQLDQAKLNLDYTDVIAAQPGRIARLTGAKGAYVNAGQSLSMYVPDDIWVTANYKETQLTYMRPGQTVNISIDAYPDHKLTGKVLSVQPGSGTVFSLLPAENATGNYVKVVQRVPVKIAVDQWPNDVSIGPGMSVVPSVKIR